MENSDTTIAKNFMESMWPLILEQNECELKSTNTCEYFRPEKKFDYLWANEFLANKRFDDYHPALEFTCRNRTADENSAETNVENECENLPYRGPHVDILRLDQQLAVLQQDVEIRKKLAYDFANRRFPWYIQRPTYLKEFKITSKIQQVFKNKFEYEILQNIKQFKCHLMIIDVAPAVPLQIMERWLKFSPYVAIVAVVHDTDLYRKLKNFNHVFQPILKEETVKLTWQEELEHSLHLGVEKAKTSFFFGDESKAVVFVFSKSSGLCVCDEFKVLRKS